MAISVEDDTIPQRTCFKELIEFAIALDLSHKLQLLSYQGFIFIGFGFGYGTNIK